MIAAFSLLAEAPQHAHPSWADFTATTWIAVVLIGLAAMWSIWKAVMYTIHPGEEEPDHIKRMILGDREPLQVELSSANGAPVERTTQIGSDGDTSDDSPAGDETAEPRHD